MLNTNLQTLINIAQKPTRHIIGLMSGTSLDGLDIALCSVKGNGINTEIKVLKSATYPYSDALKHKIRAIFAQDVVKLSQVCLMNGRIATLHSKMVMSVLADWGISPKEVDVIASHGQTIYHAPKRLHLKPHFDNSTFQIGDGDHVAYKTGILTVSDFRQKHVADSGEGAPLAIYGDYIMFNSKEENRILLNIGGIANYTFLPKNQNPKEVFATDSGAGNTLLDAVIRRYFAPKMYDEGGNIAKQGKIHNGLLSVLKKHPFFLQSSPKTTGIEVFNLNFVQESQLHAEALDMSPEDLVATLTRFTAETIAESILQYVPHADNTSIYVSGGGSHNVTLLEHIKNLLPKFNMKKFEELGFSPDIKEAVLFAVLANETLVGEPIALGQGDFEQPVVTMGKVSFPK